MMRIVPIATALLLVACSKPAEAPQQQDSADDFAARVKGSSAPVAVNATNPALDPSQPSNDMPNKATAEIPAGTDVTALQPLGDIGGVNLGPRQGGCTFQSGGQPMMIVAGMKDRALPGKGVIRVGGKLVLLDTGPGGLDAIKAGADLTGEGVNVTVSPSGAEGPERPASVTVTPEQGNAKTYNGNWICA